MAKKNASGETSCSVAWKTWRARGKKWAQNARPRPLDGAAEQELLLVTTTELARGGAEPALIHGNALGKPYVNMDAPCIVV